MPLPIKTNNLGSQGLTDGDVLLDLDDTTGSMQIMPYEHHEVHEGSHFFIEGYDSINDTDTIDFCSEVADTTAWPH